MRPQVFANPGPVGYLLIRLWMCTVAEISMWLNNCQIKTTTTMVRHIDVPSFLRPHGGLDLNQALPYGSSSASFRELAPRADRQKGHLLN